MFGVPIIRFYFSVWKEGNFENFEDRGSNFEGANKVGPQNSC